MTDGSAVEVRHDVLDAGVVLETVRREILAVATLLVATVGHLCHERDVGVDPHAPEVEALRHTHRATEVLRPDAAGQAVMSRALRRIDVLAFFERLPSCLIGMEACASAYHWAGELAKIGHDVQLMPPEYVKAYVCRQKNDAGNAAAICDAVTRPSMRFVLMRSAENQAALMHHKVRELLLAIFINYILTTPCCFGIHTCISHHRGPRYVHHV